MSQHYLSAGLGGESPLNRDKSVIQHPMPVSPSDVVDINHQNELHPLQKPEHQDFTGTGKPEKSLGDPNVHVNLMYMMHQNHVSQQTLGGTRPEDRKGCNHSHSAVTTDQSKTYLTETKVVSMTSWSAVSMNPRPAGLQVQASPTEVSTYQYEKWSTTNLSARHRVADSPLSPMMQPRTESFGLEERQEKEEIDFAFGERKKESVKTTAHKSVMDPHNGDLAKFSRKKGKTRACSPKKESESGVLFPRPTPPRDQPFVTQPSQDQEVAFSVPLSATQSNDAGYQTMQKEVNVDCHQHLYPTGHTRQVTEKEFLEITEYLSEIRQDGLWIIHHDLHPKGGAYLEGRDFTVDIIGRGGFGIVSRCVDTISLKKFIQKSVPKEKWRKAENIALLTLKGHPNICKLLGMKQESGIVSLFLEDAGFSLSHFVRTQQNKLTFAEIWDISKQMFHGLVHLHRHEILHLDLKPDNICIQVSHGKSTLKIIDFGSAKLSQEPFDFNGMTPEYLAPEVCTCFIAHQHGVKDLADTLISGKADVAAAALIILYMIEGYDVLIKPINNGQTSYTGKTAAEIKTLRAQLVMKHAYTPELATHLISDGIDVNLKGLLNGCLVGNPEERFSAQKALQFIEERENTIKGQQRISSMVFLKQLEASVASQDKFGVFPSTGHLQPLHHQNQQGRVRLRSFQQTTQAEERMVGLNSQHDPHGTNNFSAKVSNRNKHRDKTEPYPPCRHISFSASEDQNTNGTIHPHASGVIPTTVNPETFPAASDCQGGNLPNLDILE